MNPTFQNQFFIRIANLKDASSIEALIHPLVKKYISHEFTEEAEKIMLNSMNKASIINYLQQGFEYYLAEIGQQQQLVGVLGIKNACHVYHLFVDESFHKQGIAKSLWRHFLATTHCTQISVNSSHFAVEVYQSLGFTSSGKIFEKQGISCMPMVYNTPTD